MNAPNENEPVETVEAEIVDDGDDTEPVEAERDPTGDNIRQLLPVHAAPRVGGKGRGSELKVHRQPGRPRKVERMPTTSDLEYHALMAEEKERAILEDPVVKAALAKGGDPATVLRMIKIEVAKEAAALRMTRLENEKFGKDTGQTSSRRIDALVKVANLELEIRKLGAEAIDLRAERFQKIFAIWITSIRDVAGEVLSPEQLDLFFNKLTTALDGWEDRAESQIR